MTRTTPPRPFDVAAALPQLAPLARRATRLHPRAGSPSWQDSSVGGPLLWPASEPWPHCDGPHEWDQSNPALSPEDVRVQRTIRAEAARRTQGDIQLLQYTDEENAAYQQASEGRAWPEGSIPLLPVAQVYARDVPLLRTPEHADVLQVLWCPFDHPAQPRTAVFWRTAAAVDHVLAAPPEPPALQYDGYLLHPCHLTPEDVTEYPDSIELEPELRQRVENCRAWETVIAEVNGTEEVTSEEFYSEALSVAPGWKVGGWTSWNLTDPQPRSCDRCGSEMTPLLTIASAEWDDNRTTWIPEEEQIPDPGSYIEPDLAQPTMVRIAGGHNLQFYVCSESPDHPYIELAQ